MSQKKYNRPIIDFTRLCSDHGIETAPSKHKHRRPGWEQVECPRCSGNAGYHLGYDSHYARFVCYRCGWMSYEEALTKLLQVPFSEIRKLIQKYITTDGMAEDAEAFTPADNCKLPMGSEAMKERHRKYLINRNFDPDKLEAEWGLMGTGNVGPYKFRIIAPVIQRGRIVTFQGRDITNRSKQKYKACPMENEIIHHKHTLYGLGEVIGGSVMIVEGITDVWRLGKGAVATFGVKYTAHQVNVLGKFRFRFVIFDSDDPQAMEQAEKLERDLHAFRGETEIIELPQGRDPGDLTDEEAMEIRRELLFR